MVFLCRRKRGTLSWAGAGSKFLPQAGAGDGDLGLGESDRSEHGIPCSFVRDFPGLGKVIDFPRLGKSDRSEHGIPCSFVVDFPWVKFLSQAGGWGWGLIPMPEFRHRNTSRFI